MDITISKTCGGHNIKRNRGQEKQPFKNRTFSVYFSNGGAGDAAPEEGDYLYGLGVCDMKSGIAAFMQALKETNLSKLKKGIKIYITYDEEIAFAGIKEIVKSKVDMPKYIIVGEPTNNKAITDPRATPCKIDINVLLNFFSNMARKYPPKENITVPINEKINM